MESDLNLNQLSAIIKGFAKLIDCFVLLFHALCLIGLIEIFHIKKNATTYSFIANVIIN